MNTNHLKRLLDKAIEVILREDGDRDHCNHSDLRVRQTLAIADVLKLVRKELLSQ